MEISVYEVLKNAGISFSKSDIVAIGKYCSAIAKYRCKYVRATKTELWNNKEKKYKVRVYPSSFHDEIIEIAKKHFLEKEKVNVEAHKVANTYKEIFPEPALIKKKRPRIKKGA